MILTLTIVLVLLTILTTGKVNLSIRFRREVSRLFSLSNDLIDQKFTYRQLMGLPAPVQRYFKHVLKEGQSYINYVRLKHNGLFKTSLDGKWVKINGEQYFTTGKPGFAWKGITRMFTARDLFIGGKGRLRVALFSIYSILDGEGAKYDQGELLRWLAESAWFPTNLLPSDQMKWLPVDEHTANLTYQYRDISLACTVTINDAGEIIQFQTQRYMGETTLETWIGKLSHYMPVDGMRIPTITEAIWKIDQVEHSYAKFCVQHIEFGVPLAF
ncbi:MAG TPA: DUF6544 family protein [Mucilaginibacter sp.]|nr:DUF6544 family protein [Mucilaginibacter sp.]